MSWYGALALTLAALAAALVWLAYEITLAVVRNGWTDTIEALTATVRSLG